MERNVYNPHDLLAKATWDSPGGSYDFLQAHGPIYLLKRIDLSRITRYNPNFVHPELRSLHSDLIFTCPLKKTDNPLYIVVEHQATPDPRMPLRFIHYNAALIESFLKGKSTHTPWPLILNYCLYHGDKRPYPYPIDSYQYAAEPDLAKCLVPFAISP